MLQALVDLWPEHNWAIPGYGVYYGVWQCDAMIWLARTPDIKHNPRTAIFGTLGFNSEPKLQVPNM
jgi:hypothetical protein